MHVFCSKPGRNRVYPCQAAHTGPVLIATADVHLQIALYHHLAALQGQAIPRLVASGNTGYHAGSTVQFLATQHAGRSVDKAQLKVQDYDNALGSLRRIHDSGVLHGDVHLGNVILNEEVSDMTAAPAISCE